MYVVDLPGQGYTQLHDRHFDWDLAAMTGAIGTFMDAVGVPRAALAGNSWSGGWALPSLSATPSGSADSPCWTRPRSTRATSGRTRS